MSAEKTIRLQAREKLKKFGFTKALIGLGMLAVFFLVIECIASIESTILSSFEPSETVEFVIKVLYRSITIISVLLLSPCVIGYLKMFYNDNNEYEMSDVVFFFGGFKIYFKTIAFIVSYLLRMLIPTVICSIPVVGFICLNKYVLKDELPDALYNIVLYTLVIGFGLLLIIYSIKYFLSIKLYCDDQSKQLSYYFVTSKKMMKGHLSSVIKLAVSFTPWILLSITVIPLLYVVPYFTQAMCISGKWIYELARTE